MKRNCFVCRKQLVSAGVDSGAVEMNFDDPPSHATCWSSQGNWGSTVFDNCHGDPRLEISICDACLQERADMVHWYSQRPRPVCASGAVGTFPLDYEAIAKISSESVAPLRRPKRSATAPQPKEKP